MDFKLQPIIYHNHNGQTFKRVAIVHIGCFYSEQSYWVYNRSCMCHVTLPESLVNKRNKINKILNIYGL